MSDDESFPFPFCFASRCMVELFRKSFSCRVIEIPRLYGFGCGYILYRNSVSRRLRSASPRRLIRVT